MVGLLEQRYSSVRHQLDTLGYKEAFSVDSLGLVDHLLKDLVHKNEGLTRLTHKSKRVSQILEEFRNGVEPFKTEIVRLTDENSKLRLEVLKAQQSADQLITANKSRLVDLENESWDLKLLVNQFIERLQELEVESLQKTKQLALAHERNLEAVIVSSDGEKRQLATRKQRMEINCSALPFCPNCVRIRNYAEFGPDRPKDPTVLDYLKIADSRIECLQILVRKCKQDKEELKETIQRLQQRLDSAGGGDGDSQVQFQSAKGHGPSSSDPNLGMALKTAKLQLNILQRRNIDLEEQLKKSIMSDHNKYLHGRKMNKEIENGLLEGLIKAQGGGYPTMDEMTLEEKNKFLEAQLSHCCAEKAKLKILLEVCEEDCKRGKGTQRRHVSSPEKHGQPGPAVQSSRFRRVSSRSGAAGAPRFVRPSASSTLGSKNYPTENSSQVFHSQIQILEESGNEEGSHGEEEGGEEPVSVGGGDVNARTNWDVPPTPTPVQVDSTRSIIQQVNQWHLPKRTQGESKMKIRRQRAETRPLAPKSSQPTSKPPPAPATRRMESQLRSGLEKRGTYQRKTTQGNSSSRSVPIPTQPQQQRRQDESGSLRSVPVQPPSTNWKKPAQLGSKPQNPAMSFGKVNLGNEKEVSGPERTPVERPLTRRRLDEKEREDETGNELEEGQWNGRRGREDFVTTREQVPSVQTLFQLERRTSEESESEVWRNEEEEPGEEPISDEEAGAERTGFEEEGRTEPSSSREVPFARIVVGPPRPTYQEVEPRQIPTKDKKEEELLTIQRQSQVEARRVLVPPEIITTPSTPPSPSAATMASQLDNRATNGGARAGNSTSRSVPIPTQQSKRDHESTKSVPLPAESPYSQRKNQAQLVSKVQNPAMTFEKVNLESGKGPEGQSVERTLSPRRSDEKLRQTERELEGARRDREDLAMKLREVSSAQTLIELDRRNVKAELDKKNQEVEELRGSIQRYIEEVRRIEELLESKEDENELLLGQYRNLRDEFSELEHAQVSLERESDTVRVSTRQKADENTALKGELTRQASLINSYEQQIDRLTHQVSALELKLTSVTSGRPSFDSLQASYLSLENKMDALRLDLANCQSNKRLLEGENEDFRLRIAELERITGLETENRLRLQEIIETYKETKQLQDERILKLIDENGHLEEQGLKIMDRNNKMHEELGHYRLKNAEGMAELDRIRRLFENEKMERESALEELKNLRHHLTTSSASLLMNSVLYSRGSVSPVTSRSTGRRSQFSAEEEEGPDQGASRALTARISSNPSHQTSMEEDSHSKP